MVAHACNPCIWELEARGLRQVQGWPGLHNKFKDLKPGLLSEWNPVSKSKKVINDSWARWCMHVIPAFRFFLVFFFFERRFHHMAQAGLKTHCSSGWLWNCDDYPVSASWVLGLCHHAWFKDLIFSTIEETLCLMSRATWLSQAEIAREVLGLSLLWLYFPKWSWQCLLVPVAGVSLSF